MKSSIIDVPRKYSEADLFGIQKYQNALVKFIRLTNTPITIALQGEWGSGKTSLMNQLRYELCDKEGAPYFPVWVNTWQYSLMKTPPQAIMSILEGCINQIGEINPDHKWNESKKKIGGIFKKMASVGAKVAASTVGVDGDVVDELFGGESAESDILQLKKPENHPVLQQNRIKQVRKRCRAGQDQSEPSDSEFIPHGCMQPVHQRFQLRADSIEVNGRRNDQRIRLRQFPVDSRHIILLHAAMPFTGVALVAAKAWVDPVICRGNHFHLMAPAGTLRKGPGQHPCIAVFSGAACKYDNPAHFSSVRVIIPGSFSFLIAACNHSVKTAPLFCGVLSFISFVPQYFS